MSDIDWFTDARREAPDEPGRGARSRTWDGPGAQCSGCLALVASTGVSVAAPPSASAADTRIAYQCRTPNDICTVTPSGTGGVRLLNDSAVDTAPAWSPDGRQIAFFRSVLSDTTQSGVFVMNADGSGLRRVAPAPNVSGVSWSPDGTRIALGKHPDIYVARTDGTGLTRLTN